MNNCYVKAVLYAYPKLGAVADAIAQGAENRALLSYRSSLGSLDLMESIAGDFLLAEELRSLHSFLTRALSRLSEEERFMLEYKYFRRKSVLSSEFSKTRLSCSRRAYFRRQNILLEKLVLFFSAVGFTERNFLSRFSSCDFLMRLYRAAERGEEQTITRRRKGSVYQKSCSGSGAGRLPLKTNTAAATAAAHATQIAAIAAAESPVFSGSAASR